MGVVHHSRYYPWFEVGRTELFASGGKTYGDMEKEGVLLAKGYTLTAFTDLGFKPVNFKKYNTAFGDYIVDLKEKTEE